MAPKGKNKSRSGSSSGLSFQTLVTIKNEFITSYMEKTPKKAKLIDAFCVFCFIVTGLQFLYMLMVGTILKNGLYAGLFTSFGSMILTSSISFFSLLTIFSLFKVPINRWWKI